VENIIHFFWNIGKPREWCAGSKNTPNNKRKKAKD
jgi:hypothetical protein